jgi:hypothetical protein
MSIPNPIELPTEIIEQLQAVNLDISNATLAHYLAHPRVRLDIRLNPARVTTWNDQMDMHLVHLSIIDT